MIRNGDWSAGGCAICYEHGLTVVCTTCRSEVGKQCVTSSGKTARHSHTNRWRNRLPRTGGLALKDQHGHITELVV